MKVRVPIPIRRALLSVSDKTGLVEFAKTLVAAKVEILSTGGTARQLEGLVGSSVTVQFRLTPGLVLQGASSTEGESTVDLIWNRRY